MNKHVCFIIPIHQPKYRYAKDLLNSKRKYNFKNIDLYFVFSTAQDENIFKNLYKNNDYNSLVVTKLFPNINLKTDSIVVLKKLVGLLELMDKYEYLCCLDSEIIFINFVDIYKLCEKFYSKKMLYASKLPYNKGGLIYHTKFPHKYVNDEENKILQETTNNWCFWSWFNNIPIYKDVYLKQLFSYINLTKKTFIEFISNYKSNFEFFLYQYYLQLYGNFTLEIIDIELTESIIERLHQIKHNKLLIHKINPYWLPHYSKHLKTNSDDIFILFHLDRHR